MYNILLVEDDGAIREAFTMILSLSGKYNVSTAENGQIALDLCSERFYDLILLDIMMPILDGVGFLKEYTAQYHDDLAKVIIMSNLSSGSELSIIQDYGVERAILKSSMTPMKLLSIVEETLGETPAVN
ncbi:MAG TPA: response regulator [Candidatus Saccharimonadales bacterium]